MIPIFLGLSEKKNYLKDYQLSEGSWSKRRATFYWKVEAPISLCLYLEQVESCTEARSGINQLLFFSRDKFLVFSGVFLTVQTAVSSIWDRVFKNGPGKICGRQPLKIWRDMISRPYPFKFLKDCRPQILLGPCLNTLSHMFCIVISRRNK